MRLINIRFILPILAGLPISLPAQDPTLDQARHVNLERAANLPNFVVDEIDKRYTARDRQSGAIRWNYLDTLESEVTVRGIDVSRRWLNNSERIAGNFWPKAGGFGAELKPLFSPDCPTALVPAGHETLNGQSVSVYRFTSPPGGCFGFVYSSPRKYNAARRGRVLLDASGSVVQYEEEVYGLPAGFGWLQRNEIMRWDNVRIGDESYLLPVSAEFIWRLDSAVLRRVTAEYKNHRHFETATSITFK
ncbi:MAG: hypothetical protein JO336_09125 [Acidobacteriia bacterium]|nr:hypothetical protein [Terriglobia bacterium]MBV9266394.1 hypothetical protein [Acidobacteriaceae bacterium]